MDAFECFSELEVYFMIREDEGGADEVLVHEGEEGVLGEGGDFCGGGLWMGRLGLALEGGSCVHFDVVVVALLCFALLSIQLEIDSWKV